MGAVSSDVHGNGTVRGALLAYGAAGLVAAALVLLDVGAGWRGLLALPVILGGGAALGPLVFITPVEPSRLKLALISSLLSPWLLTGLFAALHFGMGLDLRLALASALASAAPLALLGLGSRVRTAPPSPQESTAVLLAVLAAAVAALHGFSGAGTALRLADGGHLVDASLADGILSSRGWTSPWFSGAPVEMRPAASLCFALVAGSVGVVPTLAAPLLAAWAAALVTAFTYLICAALARESRGRGAGARDLFAAAAVLVAPLAFPLVAGGTGGAWSLHAPSSSLAWAAAAGAALTGLHCIRSHARPWPLLFWASVLVLGLVHPRAAAAFALAMGVAGALHGKPQLAPGGLVACAPGVLQGWAYGGHGFQQFGRATDVQAGGVLASGMIDGAALALLVLAATTAPFSFRAHRRGDAVEPDRRASRGWAFALAGVGALIGMRALDGRGAEAPPLTLAALPLLCAIASACMHALPRHVARLGAYVALVVLGALAAWSERPAPPAEELGALRDGVDGLVMVGDGEPELLAVARSLAWIRHRLGEEIPEGAALIARPREGALPGQPERAPLQGGLALWASQSPPPGTYQDRRWSRAPGPVEGPGGDSWELRREALAGFFSPDRAAWTPRFERLMRLSVEGGQPLVFVLTDADHRRLRRLDGEGRPVELARLGAVLVRRAEGASVYVLASIQGPAGTGR